MTIGGSLHGLSLLVYVLVLLAGTAFLIHDTYRFIRRRLTGGQDAA